MIKNILIYHSKQIVGNGIAQSLNGAELILNMHIIMFKEELIPSLESYVFDILFLETLLPHDNILLVHIKKLRPTLKLVAINNGENSHNLNHLLINRFSGCIDTGSTPEEIRGATVLIMRGYVCFTNSTCTTNNTLNSKLVSYKSPNHPIKKEYGLTVTEIEVVVKLVQGKLIKVSATELNMTYSTFCTHRANIYRKLGVHKISEFMVKIEEIIGYLPTEHNKLS